MLRISAMPAPSAISPSEAAISARLDVGVRKAVRSNPVTADESGKSVLTGENVGNVAVQEPCPNNEPDHLMLGRTDPVAAALPLDVFDDPGPAAPERITDAVCHAEAPQVDAETAAEDLERMSGSPPGAPCSMTAAGTTAGPNPGSAPRRSRPWAGRSPADLVCRIALPPNGLSMTGQPRLWWR
ncbi:hypothetical protein [Nocardiopsis lambiniae]|uniref:Uncharacterized protein n=1 Tax=Nocardiopsis lambiniae TaxID=3075539 RepID=A0ABU2MD19_9ACTN|nr:hypothetical protein [Nocardiopsis sp. DSM 44743]MDT0330587.1 hypothetical protein [Nocardiopsis sp. DSM 44743]